MATITTKIPHPAVTHCPVCGGLECLCRPRFFAGQLLTDEDLNRLERYIIAKNKLHNRYLHGWGVACGLEVVCHQCQGWVTVTAGYALSPCGDDIVVCTDEAVNVCELIKQCLDQSKRQWDCDPAWPRPDPVCGDMDEPWVLYICYDEKPSRGVTALRGLSGAPCCSRCSCGGSSACGCDCHVKNGTTRSTSRPQPPKTSPQCEPTVTCEGYSFKLRKMRRPQPEREPGELVNHVAACLKELTKVQQAINGLSDSQQPVNDIIGIKERLVELLEEHGIYSCDLYQRIQQSPKLGDENGPSISDIQQYFGAIIVELLRQCICSALLPPCPAPVEDNCVPIATLTVNCKNGCRVVRICNWEHRRVLITFPNLEYWFGHLLHQSGLADHLMKLCCLPVRVPGLAPPVGIAVPPTAPTLSEQEAFLVGLLTEALKQQGTVSAQSVYKQLGAIVQGLLSRFKSNA